MKKNPDIKSLYYITHVENLPSILQHGVLSHQKALDMSVSFTPIYDGDIVSNRSQKKTPAEKILWEYANFYFQPRNPMMYRVRNEQGIKNIAVIAIQSTILHRPGAFITDGNAANEPTKFYALDDGLKVLADQWIIIQNDWWKSEDGSKRRIMSECLVPEKVEPTAIHSIYVSQTETKERVAQLLGANAVPIIVEPHIFFLPRARYGVGKNISLIDGDMFFSSFQTLTISVNLQGVMGKGLASRAKYQFPDVYVAYQDACRSRKITATKPFLYKREASLDYELSDMGSPLVIPNAVKWFLLFATKRKWRESSRLDDIEAGLNWVRENFAKEGVTSLALPALGCGLGNLTWANVGPLMCQKLHDIGIPVAIYLPRESQIEREFLTEHYLLGKQPQS
jgi:O-acetyl-ADP-ribose deacetylase (regulator of RNase III)